MHRNLQIPNKLTQAVIVRAVALLLFKISHDWFQMAAVEERTLADTTINDAKRVCVRKSTFRISVRVEQYRCYNITSGFAED
jgi:hypothetical protein